MVEPTMEIGGHLQSGHSMEKLPARFQRMSGRGSEFWNAGASFCSNSDALLPGTIRFALRYRAEDKEYWDNNLGDNYTSRPRACIRWRIQPV